MLVFNNTTSKTIKTTSIFIKYLHDVFFALIVFQSWRRAAEQVLYSLDVGTGHLIIYGQRCGFRYNVLRNLLVVVLMDVICAIGASLVIFGTVNIIAYKFHIPLYSVFVSGKSLQQYFEQICIFYDASMFVF